MRLIDADELLKASRIGKILYFNDTTTDGYTDVLLAVEVERAPTIEAQPVRHGKWIDMGDFIQCSHCKATSLKEFQSFYGKAQSVRITNYCPCCGARMDGGDRETS